MCVTVTVNYPWDLKQEEKEKKERKKEKKFFSIIKILDFSLSSEISNIR